VPLKSLKNYTITKSVNYKAINKFIWFLKKKKQVYWINSRVRI